jgi:hypothetical protein
VHRNVLDFHPDIYMATRQEIEAEDEQGRVYGDSSVALTDGRWMHNILNHYPKR